MRFHIRTHECIVSPNFINMAKIGDTYRIDAYCTHLNATIASDLTLEEAQAILDKIQNSKPGEVVDLRRAFD